jgi:hypothetical protein
VDPVTYPKVTIGEKPYEVRFRIVDVLALLTDHNFDIFNPLEGIDKPTRADNIRAVILMFCYAVRGAGLTITPAEVEQLGLDVYQKIAAAVAKARKKALGLSETPRQASPVSQAAA